jgi:hypothetical protein
MSGGLFALILYLLMFTITYRMLARVERAGPLDMLWLAKGLRIALILFLVFSGFGDMWLSEFLYLFPALAIAMTVVASREAPRSAWRVRERASVSVAS